MNDIVQCTILKIEKAIIMMLKLRSFARWANSESIPDSAIKEAVDEINRGLIDADLGAGLLKKRVAREGRGKSGGFRTILAFRDHNRAIFILGFPKSKQDNIGNDELRKLKILSKELLSASDAEIRNEFWRVI